jgi:hypothetical protein
MPTTIDVLRPVTLFVVAAIEATPASAADVRTCAWQ